MIVAVLQARMTSTRLPGKVLQDLAGSPMLLRQCERVLRAKRIDRLVIATSDDGSDDPIERLAQGMDVACYRGSLDDVLGRFHGAARAHKASTVVRLTGDCPLADAQVIDDVIALHLAGGSDYTSNTLERTYPKGLDVEACTVDALATAAREAAGAGEREHVTPFLYAHPQRFRLASLRQPEDQSAMRWCVDEPADMTFVRKVYERLLPKNPAFTTADILALLEAEPALARINAPPAP